MKIETWHRSLTLICGLAWSIQCRRDDDATLSPVSSDPKCSKDDILAASIVNDKIADLILDWTPWIENLMSLHGVGDLLPAKHFLNNTNNKIVMFFDEIRILRLCLNQHIFIVCYINGPPLRALIRYVSRFATPVTLANLRFGVRIVFALLDRGVRYWCQCRGFGRWLYY